MASKYRKFITFIDDSTGLVECVFCSKRWYIIIKTGGRVPRGTYKCLEGCADDYGKAYERYNKMLFRFDPKTRKKTPYKQPVEASDEK